jgi:hypothetical protein
MIWFGNLNRILPHRSPEAYGPLSERKRMLRALESVAERSPQLSGTALLDALAESGWIDREAAGRLLPEFSFFDPDRHFAEYLRGISFRGRSAASQFREGVRFVVEELTGEAGVGTLGPEPVIRFRNGDREGVVLAHPEVGFTISGPTRDAVMAAVEEMPDALVVVARNFDPQTASQLTSILDRTEVPGTLVTLNLLLGIRAHRLRYQPAPARVIELLGRGRPLRSADIAHLGDR